MLTNTDFAGRRSRPISTRAFLSELLRLLSVRSHRVLLVLCIATTLGIGIAQLITLQDGAPPADVLAAAVSGADVGPFLMGLLGVLFIASDLRSGQFALTLLTIRNRITLVMAKLSVLIVLALAAGIVAILPLIPTIALASGGEWSEAIARGTTPALLSVFFVTLGAGLALTLRSTTSAMFAYLAIVWAVPLSFAVLAIWQPQVGLALLGFAPVTLTASILDTTNVAVAIAKFFALDAVVVAVGLFSVRRWSAR